MGFIHSIKKSLYAKALANTFKQVAPQRSFKGLKQVEACAILFSKDGLFDLNDIEAFAEKLRNQGKTVHLLCYTGKNPIENLAYKTFSDKDISFNLVPKSNIIDEFTRRNTDILYNLIPLSNEVSEYISSSCNADFRVGLFDESRVGLDLMINLKDPNLKEFITTSNQILQKTNV